MTRRDFQNLFAEVQSYRSTMLSEVLAKALTQGYWEVVSHGENAVILLEEGGDTAIVRAFSMGSWRYSVAKTSLLDTRVGVRNDHAQNLEEVYRFLNS